MGNSMLYSILKDDKPENTIKKIKKIIDSLGLKLKEDFFIDNETYAPVSLRLSIKNYPNIGTNGKGTCKVNALASAYAEFIERLQNLILLPYNLKYLYMLPDKIERKTNISYDERFLQEYFHNKLLIYDKIKDEKGNYDNLLFCSFFGLKKQKVYNLPYNIICRIKGSNGMAAGNTLEEAIVQGLSEICERYAIKEILLNKRIMPDIPKTVYFRYEVIKNIINYLETNNFTVYIKDASLYGKIPVVAAIIEDTINNIFCISVGSHPSLPIAIERTLTEFTQGRLLSVFRKFNFIGYTCYSKEKLEYVSIENIYQSLLQHKIFYEKTSELEKLFFNKNYSYQFSDKAWIKENKFYTNKDLFKFLVNKVLNIAEDIYIRDVSFLKFPTVDIFVPQMSDVINYTYKNLLNENLDNFWSFYNKNINKENYNLDSLLKLAEIYSFTDYSKSKKIFNVPYEYIALLCSLVLKDSARVVKYIKIILGQNRLLNNYTDEQILTFYIIKDYYTYLNSGKAAQCIKEELKRKYNKNNLNYAFDVIEKLTFEMILDIVIKKEKTKSFRNKKFIEKLEESYKKNVPNQYDLRKLVY